MRLLHTSDWHLGRSFGAFSLLDEQRRVLERIVEVVREQSVDLVVVAGDVYDRAVPPTEAVVLLREALIELRGAGAQVAIIAGNHDSPDRVGAFEGLLQAGLHVAGGYRHAGEPVTLGFDDGEVDLVSLPFLDPLLAPDDERFGAAGADGVSRRATHASVLRHRLRSAREAVAGRRAVAIAHAFVAGGTPSESERELGVGGMEQIGVREFDGFDYVALGHLHAPQTLGRDTLGYSGSPLAYSFSETVAKSVTVVDLPARGHGEAHVERVELGVCRGVVTLTGTLDELLRAPEHEAVADRWVRVQLTDTGALVEPMARLRARFPYTVEMHRRSVAVAERGSLGAVVAGRDVRSPLRMVSSFWQATVGAEPQAEVLASLRSALQAAGADLRDVTIAPVAPVAVSAPAPVDRHADEDADGMVAVEHGPGVHEDAPATLFDDAPFVQPDAVPAGRRRLRPAS